MGVCFSVMEDCMLPSPVIQDSGFTVTALAAVYLDSGPETRRCVWHQDAPVLVISCMAVLWFLKTDLWPSSAVTLLFGSALLFCKGKSWNGTKPVCKVADIMSVLHLNQDSLHGAISAQSHDVPTSLKVRLHSHLNTAPKDAFLKTALLGVPHIRLDFTDLKQKNIRKPVEKKPSKILLFDKTRDSGRAQPINNLENSKHPIRNSALQESVTLASTNVNTISLASSFLEFSFLSSTPASFVTPVVDTQQVKIMDQTFTEAPYRRNKKGYP